MLVGPLQGAQGARTDPDQAKQRHICAVGPGAEDTALRPAVDAALDDLHGSARLGPDLREDHPTSVLVAHHSPRSGRTRTRTNMSAANGIFAGDRIDKGLLLNCPLL